MRGTIVGANIRRDRASFNPATNAARFFALDKGASVMFTISREALEHLERHEELDASQLETAVNTHWDRICEAAARHYELRVRGSNGAYQLGLADF
jgi:hypothetical protein